MNRQMTERARKLPRLMRFFLKDRKGTTAIEFSFIALPFFILVFGIIEVCFSIFVNRMVDNAVISASRLIRTGQHADISSVSDFKDKICSFMPAFMCNMNRIVVDVENVATFSDASSTNSLYDSNGELKEEDKLSYKIGSASSIVVVKVIYRWPRMTSVLNLALGDNGTEQFLTSTMVFRNEPWQ